MHGPPSLPSLSVLFPCFNDAPTIRGLVIRADEIASRLTDDYEIVVVDDGSTDDSLDRLRRLEQELSALRVTSHPENLGYGAALRTGFRLASKSLLFYTDGDGQYDVRELILLTARLGEGVDAVNGYKIRRSDPWYRRLAGRCYTGVVRAVFGLGIRDVDCDFRLIRREFLDRIVLEMDSGMICVELVARLQRAGCRFAEVPVGHYPRRFGRSQFFRARRVLRTLWDGVRLWRRLKVEEGAQLVRSPADSPSV